MEWRRGFTGVGHTHTLALQGTPLHAAARKGFAAQYGGHGDGAYSVEQRSVRRDGRSLREWRRTEGLLWCFSTFADRGKSEMEVAAMEVGALCMVATFQTRVAL